MAMVLCSLRWIKISRPKTETPCADVLQSIAKLHKLLLDSKLNILCDYRLIAA